MTPTLAEILALLSKEYGPVIADCAELLFRRALLSYDYAFKSSLITLGSIEIIAGWIMELRK